MSTSPGKLDGAAVIRRVGNVFGAAVAFLDRSRRIGWTDLALVAGLGGGIYGLGLLMIIATGISTPFQQAYVPIHIYLAFLAFMSLVAGLGICHAVTACLLASARLRQGGWAVLLTGAFLYLTYVFFTPAHFAGRRWFLAATEWALGALIAASTASLTVAIRNLVVAGCDAQCGP